MTISREAVAAQYYTGQMSKHLESLYQNLLNGKLPHNLSWSEAVELVEHLGEVATAWRR